MIAITAALVCSAAGGCPGLVVLAFLILVATRMVLMFSFPDFFMLAVFGFVLVSRLARGTMLLGLTPTALGWARAREIEPLRS